MSPQSLFSTPAFESVPVGDASPEAIADLSNRLVMRMTQASTEIRRINDRTRLLSFNAQVEAAHAGGAAGATFSVVANAIRDLSDKTALVSENISRETAQANESLQQIIKTLATNVRGTRLADLALTNIDLIDRNLYERSCDVRWWATDSSVVQALREPGSRTSEYCAQRLGVILDSYTVYYDLVLCDRHGRIVANGRPHQYATAGIDCSQSAWFQAAMATSSSTEFGFQTVHASPLVDGKRILAYSCGVRDETVAGAPLGVLGILFNWDALAQTIVQDTPLIGEEKARTRVCIVDDHGLILADSRGMALQETLHLTDQSRLFSEAKNFTLSTYENLPCCVGHARSPGYETYATGWHSVLIQTSSATVSDL